MSRLWYIAPLMLGSVSSQEVPKAFFMADTSRPTNTMATLSPPVADTLPPAPAPALAPESAINRSRDGLFYIQATVNGAPIRFVVDSGSSVVVLNAADAARAKVGLGTGVDVETANGSAVMHRARIDHVVLAGRTLLNVDAAIVRSDLEVSLLGQSALSQFGSVTFTGDRLAFQ